MTDRTTNLDIDNTSVNLPHSKTFYERIYEMATKSPGATISSICALFITVTLAIVIPSILSEKFCKCNSS